MFEHLLRGLRRRPAPFDAERWQAAAGGQAALESLGEEARPRLWSLAQEFLRTRAMQPVGGLELDADARLRIALLAALPILELDLSWYRGLHEVVIYPAGFAPEHRWEDEAGVVHTERRELSGEAWDQGLLILSWDDVEKSGKLDGNHVVLHECAHWLDMQAGDANGRPPLHAGMSAQDWSEAFTRAYAAFQRKPRRYPSLDPYAAEAPEEFFAVACEAFFELPHQLARDFPQVYDQLSAFFRQDPRKRITDAQSGAG
jgi:MtfA peptidase